MRYTRSPRQHRERRSGPLKPPEHNIPDRQVPCQAHSGQQHADCPVRLTLREVCYGMQPTASLSRAWRRSDVRGAGDGSSRLG
jgi:hypothetical protein